MKKIRLILLIVCLVIFLGILYYNNAIKLKYNKATNMSYSVIFDKDNNEICRLENSSNYINSYFVDAVVEEVINQISLKENIDKNIAAKKLYNGGYSIYTTCDLNKQRKLEEIYLNSNYFENDAVQSAAVVIDYKSGDIVALIGGRGEKSANRIYNRATTLKKAPGNVFNILSVYAPAIEKGVITKDTIYVDEPLEETNYKPKNSDLKFRGEVTIKQAVDLSLNIIPIKVLKDIGIDYSYDFIKKIGIKSVLESDKNLASLALGGLNKGVNIIEMASAFGTIGNDGEYIESKLYTKILYNSESYIENETGSNIVMKKSTTEELKSLLKIDNTDIYSKYTTNNKSNTSLYGFNNNYSVGIWYGYENNNEIKSFENVKLILNQIIK